jgi:DNA polymerase II
MKADRATPAQSELHSAQIAVGFVVHSTWFVHAGVPEIHLYGRLNSGETFLIIDTRDKPKFYLRIGESVRAREIASRFGAKLSSTSRRTMDGEEIESITVSAPGKLGALRRAFGEAGIRTYEADVPFAWSYLIDRHLRGAIEICGSWQKGSNVSRIYRNPGLSSNEAEPTLVTVSLSLDLDPQTGTIQAAALAGTGSQLAQKVSVHLALVDSGRDADILIQSTERDLLLTFRHSLCQIDPDVITGWDVVSTVLVPLKERMAVHGIPFNLGRSNRLSRVTLPSASSDRRRRGNAQAIIEGRQILDARNIVRSGQRRFDDLELATVSRDVLGCEPISVSQRARVVLDILEADNLIQLTVRRSLLIGIPLQRAWTSVQAFDFLYLSELHARGVVAPTRDVDRQGGAPAPGGLILSPRAGKARNVLVLDFKSLYPSIIRTFNIDPAAQITDPADGQDVILAPNGAAFSREPGILPMILDRFFESRAKAKSHGDTVASYAYKIIMNSFYGVLGTSSCRFGSQSISGAITSFGQHLLRWTRDVLEVEGFTVIYGDTDSLFVDARIPADGSPEEATQLGQTIADRINDQLNDYLSSTYGVVSRLELEMEKVYTRFFLPTVRGENRGRAKGYAGLIVDSNGDHVDVVGMEAVRRDWTTLARRFQRELLDLAFHDATDKVIESHVSETLKQLRRGDLDAELVYRKTLRKPLDEYIRSQPPHVQAAAMLPEAKLPGDVVRYVVTLRGPRPIENIDAALDYTHIIQKQLAPIAKSLDALIHLPEHLFGSGQIELF